MQSTTATTSTDGVDVDRQEADTVDYRKYLASKVYRSCCVMRSMEFKVRMVSTMFAWRPMHWLWQRLEWLDARCSGLLDVGGFAAAIADRRSSHSIARGSTAIAPVGLPEETEEAAEQVDEEVEVEVEEGR